MPLAATQTDDFINNVGRFYYIHLLYSSDHVTGSDHDVHLPLSQVPAYYLTANGRAQLTGLGLGSRQETASIAAAATATPVVAAAPAVATATPAVATATPTVAAAATTVPTAATATAATTTAAAEATATCRAEQGQGKAQGGVGREEAR